MKQASWSRGVRQGQAGWARVSLGPRPAPQALPGSEPQCGNPHYPHLLRTTRPWRLEPPPGPQFPLPKSGLLRLSVCARVNARRVIQEVLASHLPGRGSREGTRCSWLCVCDNAGPPSHLGRSLSFPQGPPNPIRFVTGTSGLVVQPPEWTQRGAPLLLWGSPVLILGCTWSRTDRPSQVAQLVKDACSAEDLGLIPGLDLSQEEPLEKGMATHSSILAWRFPRTEEPSGLQSTGSRRVGQD